jgi:hypothetical protein
MKNASLSSVTKLRICPQKAGFYTRIMRKNPASRSTLTVYVPLTQFAFIGRPWTGQLVAEPHLGRTVNHPTKPAPSYSSASEELSGSRGQALPEKRI